MNFLDPDEVTVLAGEYALGVLPSADKAAFETELLHNRSLSAAVAFWNDRLLEIAPAPQPVVPTADLWQRIERSLAGKSTPSVRASWWDSLGFWRLASKISITVAMLLATGLLFSPRPASRPQYLAVLQAPATGTNWLVEIDQRAVHLRPLSPTVAGAGKAIQFWTKPVGAAGPTSLGLVHADGPTDIALAALPGLGPNQLFEVTLEPATGSLIGRPTGPVLAVGRVARL